MSYSKTVLFVLANALVLTGAGSVFPQRNNPFSANPEVQTSVASIKAAEPQQVDIQRSVKVRSLPTIDTGVDPTRLYKVGAGDTLQIVLANAPNASGYYSVRADGTIDFPLAGDSPAVRGMTTSQIEQMLASRVKLYRDARLQVTVREFGSHKINVSGLVERNGERSLQREAMPLFTVEADVGVRREATRVVIRRSSGGIENYNIGDLRTDDVRVSAGDTIEFAK